MSLLKKRPKNTARMGEITECAVLAKLVELGYKCLIPWGHDQRYDIAIDDEGKLIRVQCKTARYLEDRGCIDFSVSSLYARVGGKPHIRKNYQGEIDYFGVYSPDTGKVYLVPIEDTPDCSMVLRLQPTRNN